MNRHTPLTRYLAAFITLLLSAPSLGLAATVADIRVQIEQGNYEQALSQSEDYLEANPEDRDARFIKGVALANTGKTSAAIEAFGELARDYPDMPEPANNLAVLYAQKGEYEKARRWLEAAMSTHPAYATAHKNLGDIYTALAAVAYSKALDDEEAPSDLGVRLELVDKIYQGSQTGTAVASASKQQTQTGKPAVVPAPKPKPEPARPPQTAEPEQAPAPTEPAEPEQAAEPTEPAEPEQTPAPAEPAEPAQADASQPEAQPQPTEQAGRASLDSAVQAVRDWAQAWSNQNVEAYLDSYADNFYPGDGLTLNEWRTQRHERLRAPAFIKVNVIDPQAQRVSDERVRVSFRQSYESDTYSDRVNKTLVLQRKDGDWRIVRELSEPLQ